MVVAGVLADKCFSARFHVLAAQLVALSLLLYAALTVMTPSTWYVLPACLPAAKWGLRIGGCIVLAAWEGLGLRGGADALMHAV